METRDGGLRVERRGRFRFLTVERGWTGSGFFLGMKRGRSSLGLRNGKGVDDLGNSYFNFSKNTLNSFETYYDHNTSQSKSIEHSLMDSGIW